MTKSLLVGKRLQYNNNSSTWAQPRAQHQTVSN